MLSYLKQGETMQRSLTTVRFGTTRQLSMWVHMQLDAFTGM